MARKDAYITLKDHKENLKLRCRLINPAKREMGRVNKSILERITQNVRGPLEINEWKIRRRYYINRSVPEDREERGMDIHAVRYCGILRIYFGRFA